MNTPRAASTWKKSSYSKSSYCVEVAQDADVMAVRDSKSHVSGFLLLSRKQWSRFLAVIKSKSSRFH